jgi:hypothetical protein
VYHRQLDGKVLRFGNTSALYENSMVMFDHGTGSYWYQVSGRAIVGELTGPVLQLLPSITQTWGDWKELHPDTLVLSRQQVVPGDYSYLQDLFRNYDAVIEAGDTTFPLSRDKVDKTLRLPDIVLTVGHTSEETVYPLALLGDGAPNDVVGNERVVVLSRAAGPWGAAYSRAVGDQVLAFRATGEAWVDGQTGSTWNFAGWAEDGPLQGTQLRPLPG